MSIYHCVFFKFRADVPAEECQEIYDQLGDLQDKVAIFMVPMSALKA